jgi:hypothetical protein
LTLSDRIDSEGEREAIAVFEDGSNDILTNIKIRRAPIQSPPQSGAPAVSEYAETRTGLPGRPSAKALVKAEFGKRIAAGDICETLKEEAEALKMIIANRLPRGDVEPKPGSIENMIRKEYREAKHAGKNTR